jgi:outer membrane protein OmpA-like peptidoglycan-associated protein
MRRNTLILLIILSLGIWTACQQGDAGNENESEQTEEPSGLNEVDFLEGSVARGLMAALEQEEPYGIEVPFHYVSFDPGSMVITGNEEGLREIDELASVMNANPRLNIAIHAYVDASNSGDSEPRRVARMRTFFIKSRLIDNGVSPQLIETEGVTVESPEENRLLVMVLGE